MNRRVETNAVAAEADWILDLGPGGGVNGGEIVAEGTPETVAASARSFTGTYLKETLARSPAQAGVQGPEAGIQIPKKKRSKKPAPSKTEGAEADQPDLLVAK